MMLSRFLQDNRASAAPMLALTALPIMAAIGVSIDYGRANSVRVAMQSALDSAALMLTKTAADQTADQISVASNSFFNTLFIRPEVQNVSVTSTFNAPQGGSFELTLKGNASVPTTFARLIGQSQIDISATSQVLWGMKKLELVLALDNTGSMSSNGKMTALKTAAHNLLNTLKSAARKDGDVKVAIVPFATDVNVKSVLDEAYIDFSDWETKNGTCSSSYYSTKSSCVSHGKVWTPADRSTWNGCVWDRDQNADVNATPVVIGATGTMYAAHQASACPTGMVGLNYDWTALHNKVDAMTPTGNTNVTIGLQMAYQMLSPVAPFNAPAPAPDTDKVIVLLTDGDNTQNRWTSSQSSIDARTNAVCNNIQAERYNGSRLFKIYTVRVINGNATLLRNCATEPTMYYDVDQANQLNNVFSSIADKLSQPRIGR